MKPNPSKKSVIIDSVLLALCIGAIGYYRNDLTQICLFSLIAFRPFIDLVDRFFGYAKYYKFSLMLFMLSSFLISMYILSNAHYMSAINIFVITIYSYYKLDNFYRDEGKVYMAVK